MLLTISTTHRPATDLGYLLHKNPSRPQSFKLSFGTAHVVYPEASDDRCTAALILDLDPIGLVRGRRGLEGEGGLLMQYVNDRPYVASSFLSVAISQVFRSALAGRSKDREALTQAELPLEAGLAVVPCRGGESFLRRLFEPLGYEVAANAEPLDPTVPDWGASRYYTVQLRAQKRLADLLTHLYVLVPVLDDEKHYWVGDDEVEKLVRHGEGWLSTHPERDVIAARYLKHRHSLVRDAIARLVTANTCGSSTVQSTRCLRISIGFVLVASRPSAHSRCESSRSASKGWSALCARSRYVACTSVCSGSWHSRANLSIRASNDRRCLDTQAIVVHSIATVRMTNRRAKRSTGRAVTLAAREPSSPRMQPETTRPTRPA